MSDTIGTKETTATDSNAIPTDTRQQTDNSSGQSQQVGQVKSPNIGKFQLNTCVYDNINSVKFK